MKALRLVLCLLMLGTSVTTLVIVLGIHRGMESPLDRWKVAPFPEYNAKRLEIVIAKVDSLDQRFRIVETKLADVATAWNKDSK